MRARSASARGQAAVEFLFAMLVLIALASVLFQALQFELDVFNKSAVGRYQGIKKIRDNELNVVEEQVSVEITGKKVSELLPFTVMFQPTGSIGNLKFGPRRYYLIHGTKYWDPSEWGIKGALIALLAADHREEAAGKAASVIGAFSGFLNSLQF